MLLAILICHLSVTLANPFHKYPYVFLLDVGNEELQNTHTDQIRLSVPGGSVALRYPAIGDGETITHVRVSGIDFGTDLKANILDGGPGYKYVVFVFMGNSGAPYDTVVTLKTISNDKNVQFNVGNDVSDSESQVSDDNDPNDSAEDFNDDSKGDNDDSVSQTYVEKSNAELTQSSSNVYAYAQKEEVNNDDYDDNNDDNNENNDEKDIHIQNKANYDKIDEQNVETKDYVEDDDDQDQGDETDQDQDEVSDTEAEKYSDSEDYEENDQQQPIVVDRNLYDKYEPLKPHSYDGGEVYPQDQVPQNFKPLSEPLDDEDTDEYEQMFNDEEIHNDADKYTDTNNNNYIDSDDPSAVAY